MNTPTKIGLIYAGLGIGALMLVRWVLAIVAEGDWAFPPEKSVPILVMAWIGLAAARHAYAAALAENREPPKAA